MKRRPERLSLIERAMVERDWHAGTVDARIKAMIGGDARELVHSAGVVLYVTLGALRAEEVETDQDEVQTVLAAVEAVHDQAEVDEIPEPRRAAIVAGLEACALLVPHLERRSLTNSACELKLKLRRQHLHLSDFHELMTP